DGQIREVNAETVYSRPGAGARSDQPEPVSDGFVDPRLQARLRRSTCAVGDQLAALEHHQRRDSAHAELGRQARVLVDVHLGDLQLALVLGRELLERRADLTAGAAPLRPEIHQDRNIRAEYLGLEGLVRYLDRRHWALLAFRSCNGTSEPPPPGSRPAARANAPSTSVSGRRISRAGRVQTIAVPTRRPGQIPASAAR